MMETTKIVAPYYNYKQEAYRSLVEITKKLLSRSILKDSSRLPNERFFFYKAMIGEEDYLQVWLLDEEVTKVPLDSTFESKKFILMVNLEDGRIISDLKIVYKYFSEANFDKLHEALENIYSVGDETDKFQLSDIFKGSVESVVITSEYIGITLDTNVVFLSRGIEV